MKKTLIVAAAVASAALTATLAAPRPAHACGGFFCQRSPMNQSGEKIVFAVEEDGTLTAHVQIVYSGTAESFAWILPVPTEPTLATGTDALFSQIDRATAPRFQLERETVGTCREEPRCDWDEPWDESPYPPSYGSADAGAAADSGGRDDVMVHLREAVGPYDAVVLSSGDVEALRTWLRDNGYDIPDQANDLLEHYVSKGDYFVALKLLQDRGVGEVQPIALRFEERQPCIPIRLTAIATVPDMPITAWVLGRSRAAPYNYMSVRPDLELRELYMGGDPSTYRTLVTNAVDDAGGKAFVTEYSGDVPDLSLSLPEIDDLRDVTDPGTFLMRLQERGFSGDSQLMGILLRHIPPPEDAEPRDFYNCIVNDWCMRYDAYLSELEFDPAALVDNLEEAVLTPRREAEEMLGRHPQITRMFTTMSADEMNEDPVFVLDDDMPEVSNVHTATLVTECSPEYFRWAAPQKIVFASGAEEMTREGVAYPGTDAEYCEDRRTGDFGPYADPETLRETAEMRATTVAGGGGCSAAPAAAAGSGLGTLLLGALLLAIRRRR